MSFSTNMNQSSFQISGSRVAAVGSTGATQQIDIGTLMMLLQLERTGNIDKQLGEMLGEIDARNKRVKNVSEFIDQMRKLKAEGKSDIEPVTINGVTKTAAEWATEFGISWTPVGTPSPENDPSANWEANLQNAKSLIDSLNNDSQVMNVRMQNLIEKRNNAFEMASKFMATNNQSVQSVIRNL